MLDKSFEPVFYVFILLLFLLTPLYLDTIFDNLYFTEHREMNI